MVDDKPMRKNQEKVSEMRDKENTVSPLSIHTRGSIFNTQKTTILN